MNLVTGDHIPGSNARGAGDPQHRHLPRLAPRVSMGPANRSRDDEEKGRDLSISYVRI